MKEIDLFEHGSLDLLLAVFANAKPINNGFLVESFYKQSKYSYNLSDLVYIETNKLMSHFFGVEFELIGTRHQLFIESRLNSKDFFQKIYQKILQKRVLEQISDDEFEKKILVSFFVLRGSVDFKLNFYSLDLLRDVVDKHYLELLFKLLTNIRDLRQLNLNFREFQGQFISGENQRNTQFRINLAYFYDRVGKTIANLNHYKAYMLNQNKHLIRSPSSGSSKTFIERLIFYTENVLHQVKTENEIKKLRIELGFSDEKHDETSLLKRNQSISQYARYFLDDECVACKDEYHVNDRTFKYRKSDRYYLEVHHCISFSADSTCDQIDNLVKLCPACHRALTKNRANEDYQKKLIHNILKNAPKTKEFCLNFTDEVQVVQFIYDRLR